MCFAYCWKAIGISLLLVVVLLNSKLYRQSYDHMKGALVPEIDRFGFAICEVSSYLITPFFIFLENYEDFDSFGGCFAQFQCVFAGL